MTADVAITVGLSALGLINAWALYLLNEGKKDRAAIWDAIAKAQSTLSEFKEKVARDHVTTEMLTKVEERVIQAIDRLADRLDRVFENNRNRNNTER